MLSNRLIFSLPRPSHSRSMKVFSVDAGKYISETVGCVARRRNPFGVQSSIEYGQQIDVNQIKSTDECGRNSYQRWHNSIKIIQINRITHQHTFDGWCVDSHRLIHTFNTARSFMDGDGNRLERGGHLSFARTPTVGQQKHGRCIRNRTIYYTFSYNGSWEAIHGHRN